MVLFHCHENLLSSWDSVTCKRGASFLKRPKGESIPIPRWVSTQKIGGKPPKMDGEHISWKTLLKWDDLGGFPPLFLVQHPDI